MIAIHYSDDPFIMNQWAYLAHVFKQKMYVLDVPADVTLHRTFTVLNDLTSLEGSLVYVDRFGDTILSEHTHEKNDILVFGPDNINWKPLVPFRARVQIPQFADGDLYACQAGAIAIYDRVTRG